MVAPQPVAVGHRHLPSGWRLVVLEETDTTMDVLQRPIDNDPGDGMVVVAKRQSAGVGRRGRPWHSPPGGNLYVSIRLRHHPSGLQVAAQLSFVGALALADAVKDVAPHVVPCLKWPNDVLVNGGKLAGVLLRVVDEQWIVIGAGINLMDAPVVPPPATSLQALGAYVGRMEMLFALCRHLSVLTAVWREQGFAPIRAGWISMSAGIGKQIVARLCNGREKRGRFVDLDAEGALMLETSSTTRCLIHAADVVLA